jgi:predicted transcriptional regulator
MNRKTFRAVKRRTGIATTTLATKSKINRTTISLYESGAVQLSKEQLAQLVTAFETAISERIAGFEKAIKLLRGKKEAASDGAERTQHL